VNVGFSVFEKYEKNFYDLVKPEGIIHMPT